MPVKFLGKHLYVNALMIRTKRMKHNNDIKKIIQRIMIFVVFYDFTGLPNK